MGIMTWWKQKQAMKKNLALQNELLRIRRVHLEILNVPPNELAILEALGVVSKAVSIQGGAQ